MKPFLASPNQTIEAVSQKLKLKMASVKRDTNCPKRKEMLQRQKKTPSEMCPTTLLQMLAQPRRMSSIKFHSSTSEARDSLHASSCQNRRSYTVFSVSQHVSPHGYTIMEQPVARDLFQSEAAGIMLVEPQQSSNNSLCSHVDTEEVHSWAIFGSRITILSKAWIRFNFYRAPPLARPMFHSSTSEARDSLHASSCQNRRSYTVFSVSCWHWGGTLMSLQDHNTFQSLN